AFKNIQITSYDKLRPDLSNLDFLIYGGRFEEEPDLSTLSPEVKGSSDVLTSRLKPKSDQYMIRYTGTLDIKEAGEYTFNLNVPGGLGQVTVNNEEALDFGR